MNSKNLKPEPSDAFTPSSCPQLLDSSLYFLENHSKSEKVAKTIRRAFKEGKITEKEAAIRALKLSIKAFHKTQKSERTTDSMPPLVIKEICQTCFACPSQWEGTLEDERMIYIRYRWGRLSVRVSLNPTNDIKDAVRGKEILNLGYGDEYGGVLEFEELVKLAKDLLIFP